MGAQCKRGTAGHEHSQAQPKVGVGHRAHSVDSDAHVFGASVGATFAFAGRSTGRRGIGLQARGVRLQSHELGLWWVRAAAVSAVSEATKPWL